MTLFLRRFPVPSALFNRDVCVLACVFGDGVRDERMRDEYLVCERGFRETEIGNRIGGSEGRK